MSYDDTSYYGDLIVDEYDDKCNFIGTNTPMGYLAYHLLGDGFDLMSEMCSKFMNDFSILTADTRGLDNFWGVSYNMPRPLLYEGQKREYLFEDACTISDNKSDGYFVYVGTTSFDENGLTLSSVYNSSQYQMNVRLHNQVETVPFIVEFDMISNNTDKARLYFYPNGFTGDAIGSGVLWTSPQNEVTHFKFTVTSDSITRTVNGTTTTLANTGITDTVGVRFGYYQNTEGHIKIRNYKVYRGDDKERPLNDEEYRVYLYIRNCRLLTREDLLINMQKCFGFDDYEIVLSDEQFYLEASDHLNYEAMETVGSNLHKNSEDTSLHFVTDYSNDETTETIESGLSTEEELVTVVNIPYNEWDKEFLELMEQYISVKGNIKIKEYHL